MAKIEMKSKYQYGNEISTMKSQSKSGINEESCEAEKSAAGWPSAAGEMAWRQHQWRKAISMWRQ